MFGKQNRRGKVDEKKTNKKIRSKIKINKKKKQLKSQTLLAERPAISHVRRARGRKMKKKLNRI